MLVIRDKLWPNKDGKNKERGIHVDVVLWKLETQRFKPLTFSDQNECKSDRISFI
jgi:hypothetical protein